MPKNFDFDAQIKIFPKLGTAAEIARNHRLALFILRGRGFIAMGYKCAIKMVKTFFSYSSVWEEF